MTLPEHDDLLSWSLIGIGIIAVLVGLMTNRRFKAIALFWLATP